MKLAVENFGPISEGRLNLNKRLLILTGPNNSGKSYLTYLLYGISQIIDISDRVETRKYLTGLFQTLTIIDDAIEHGTEINLNSILTEKINDISTHFSEITTKSLPTIFASKIIEAKIFLNFDDFRLDLRENEICALKVENNKLIAIYANGETDTELFYLESFSRHENIRELVTQAIYIFTMLTIQESVEEKTHFFPAERTAINLFAKHITSTKAEIKDELDSDVIYGMSDEELGRRLKGKVKNAPKYPYAIRDYINFVNNFKADEEEGPFASIADKIEQTLIGGKVQLDRFDQILFIPENSDQALELHLSSSLVKSLSYLALYLRYTAKVGYQIIIDEPELNLHPNLQVGFARIITELVNKGLNVVISTHSDYLIKELNNLMLLHELSSSVEGQLFIEEKGYSESLLLNQNHVGVYYLNNNSITLIDVKEQGISVPSINDTINDIDNLTQEILHQL